MSIVIMELLHLWRLHSVVYCDDKNRNDPQDVDEICDNSADCVVDQLLPRWDGAFLQKQEDD